MTAFEKIHIDHLQARVDHYASVSNSSRTNITGVADIFIDRDGDKWVQIEFKDGDNLIFEMSRRVSVGERADDEYVFKEAVRKLEIDFIEQTVALCLHSSAIKDDLSKAIINAVIAKRNEHAL